jgi:hypothetical protein
MLVLVLLVACGDNSSEVAVDAARDPITCSGLEAITVPADDVGEVLLDARVITPGISYACGASTWTYWTRRRVDDGRLGSYGKFRIGSTECAWFDAIDSRTPATGACSHQNGPCSRAYGHGSSGLPSM